MITLLGALVGFLTSVFPDILKLYRDRQDREHELIILRMQMEQQAQGHSERMEAIGTFADIAEMQSLGDRIKPIGITWVDALNATVRPVIAYAFFLLYATAKVMQFSILPDGQLLPWQIGVLWGDEDKAIFSAIIAFYFGSRALQVARRKG